MDAAFIIINGGDGIKRNTIGKMRIWPTILGMAVLFIGVALFSALALINTLINTFYMDCASADKVAGQLATVLEQSLAQKTRTLTFYADVLAASENISEAELQKNLAVILEQEEFSALGIISGNDKNVFTSNGAFTVMEAREFYYAIQASNMQRIFTNGTLTIYAVPFAAPGYENAYLLGAVNACMSAQSVGNELGQGAVLYLLDADRHAVSYYGQGNTAFNYAELDKASFYSAAYQSAFANAVKGGDENLDTGLPSLFISPAQLGKKMQDFGNILTTSSRIWYEKPVNYADAADMTLLVGQKAAFSGESISIMLNIGVLVAIILLLFFLITVYLIGTRYHNNVRLSRTAYLDFVTQQGNFARFLLDAKKYLKKRRSRRYALVTFDIHKFRILSDTDGGETERMLLQIAEVLRGYVGKNECYARYANDEFAVLMKYLTPDEHAARVRRLDARLKKMPALAKLCFHYGAYYITDYEMPVQRMYIYASMAKDEAIQQGVGEERLGVFSDAMRQAMLFEKELESNMRAALDNEEFVVYLQPKYFANGVRVGGAEALVRWNSPTMGFIPPGKFIPLFERNGFIMQLDSYMLRHVCAFQQKQMAAGRALVCISVNMSRAHMLDPMLVEEITAIVDSYQVPYSAIELELTESAFFDDKRVLLDAVHALRSRGFSVSMDDFGSGYSSLNSLKDLPLDVIKLDCEFFTQTEDAARGRTVIADTIALAKHLHMEIVAEGIETEEQVALLNELGCDFIQGYYFAKPMPLEQFEQLMDEERRNAPALCEESTRFGEEPQPVGAALVNANAQSLT